MKKAWPSRVDLMTMRDPSNVAMSPQQTVSQCSVGNGGLKRGRRRIAGEVLEHTRVGYLEPDVRCCGFPFALVLRSCDL